ncbi:MAG: molybdopterin molybdotransferase MoeA [Pseudobacteriovorax sp.]|nr:molybdopterin molybdotransferase MoeA [Pseudobacteriovorax sp.]
MLDSVQAKKLVMKAVPLSPTKTVNSDSVTSETLRCDIKADRDSPPFDRVAMDGIAIVFETYEGGQREYKIEGCQAAGAPQLSLSAPSMCLEVMTGSSMPEGCDTVIPYERVAINDGIAVIDQDAIVKHGQNIHKKGSDYQKGQVLLTSGTTTGPSEWGTILSSGYTSVSVSTKPKIAIISTGDELVDFRNTPLPHQIRQSNVWAIQAALKRFHFDEGSIFHINDQLPVMMKQTEDILKNFDFILFSGGVSRGKFDFVPEALNSAGVSQTFHRVAQKPGKPLWFGQGESQQMVFGLPGNPISTQICFYEYVLPALCKFTDSPLPRATMVKLGEPVVFKKPLTLFQLVTRSESSDEVVYPVKNNGSGDYYSLTRSQGYITLPQAEDSFKAGQKFPAYFW